MISSVGELARMAVLSQMALCVSRTKIRTAASNFAIEVAAVLTEVRSRPGLTSVSSSRAARLDGV